jgi:hypothetical protein
MKTFHVQARLVAIRRRADCLAAERPCPHVACRYHLATEYREVKGGWVRIIWRELPRGAETCALDVADRARKEAEKRGAKTLTALTLMEIADILGISPQRVHETWLYLRQLMRRDPDLRKYCEAEE